MLATATPHAIAITSVMPRLIDEDGRGLATGSLDRPQDASFMVKVFSSFFRCVGDRCGVMPAPFCLA
ncbi:MAG: hypothetical protein WCB02_24320 [Bradyrhizobium sp.]